MSATAHRVARETVEIVAADRTLADRLARRVAALAPRLAELLDRHFGAADDGRRYRLDRLVLDLGGCDPARFEDDLIAALDRTLADTLSRHLARTAASDAVDDALDLIAHVAATGALPWWAPDEASLTAAVETLAGQGAAALDGIRFVLALPDAPGRLARSVPGEALARLSATAMGLDRGTLAALALRLAAATVDADPVTAMRRAWTTLLRRAAGPKTPTPDALARDLGIAAPYPPAPGGESNGASDLAPPRIAEWMGKEGAACDRQSAPSKGGAPATGGGIGRGDAEPVRDASRRHGKRGRPTGPTMVEERGSDRRPRRRADDGSPDRAPRQGAVSARAGKAAEGVIGNAGRAGVNGRSSTPADPTSASAPAPDAMGSDRAASSGTAGSRQDRLQADGDRQEPRTAPARHRGTAPVPIAAAGGLPGLMPAPGRDEPGLRSPAWPGSAGRHDAGIGRPSHPAEAPEPRQDREGRHLPAEDGDRYAGDPAGRDPAERRRQVRHDDRGEIVAGEDSGAAMIVQADEDADRGGGVAISWPLPPAPAAPSIAPASIALVRVAAPGHDALYLDNAGVALVWPFFPRLLAEAGLLHPDGGLHRQARARAAMLLDHLVTGDREPPETGLALARLLAGLPVDAAFDPGPPLTDAESAAAAAMLSAALEALPMLGRIGIGGLRGSWLARPGRLAVEHGGWTLRIERRAWDVLLARVPWTVAGVALPWMPDPVVVEW